jgi:hypothetical protein
MPPNGLSPWKEPRRCKWRRISLASELAVRNTNDVRHPSPPLPEKVIVLHRLPPQREGMLGAQAAPPIIIDGQLLA